MSVVTIPLTRGYAAIVDEADAERVLEHTWSAAPTRRTVYAQRSARRPDGSWTTQRLHAFLTGTPETVHRNGDGLDNRRENLREGTRARPAAERFAEKIVLMETGCIEWTGATNGVGYGMFFLEWVSGRDLRVLAHRWSYEHHIGAIPDGFDLDHLCRNPACVNPDHLEPVTHRENILRGISPPAVHAAKTHCVNGHPLSGENLMLRSNGRWRDCRECTRAKHRRRYYRKKAA